LSVIDKTSLFRPSLLRPTFLRQGLLALTLFAAACAPQAPAPAKPAAEATSVPAAKPATEAKPAADAKPAAPAAAAAPKANGIAMGPQLAGDEAIAKDRSGSGGTLTVAMSAGNIPYPNTPPNEGFEGRRFVGYQIYDGILNFNLDQPDSVPVPGPGLAESWKIEDDKLTWTFKLRQGVKFHDGTPFGADDVVFNLDRMLNKDFEFYDPDVSLLNRSNLISVDSYKKVDENTVQIKTKYPYSILPYEMCFITIASPTTIKKVGNKDYIKTPVGTGPFKVVKYTDGQALELEPNAEYWGGKPKLDKLILRPMPDPATRLAALQSGEVQWAEVPPPDSVAQLRSGGFNVLLKQYPHTILFFLNLNDPPFNNPKVRQAIQYAVDRDKMCNDLLNGLCTPSYQYWYEGHPWYNAEIGKKYAYDPARAKALLAEAGFPSGLQINIAYPTGGSGNMWPQPMMELLQANFKAVGIDMKITPLEWNNILTIQRASFNAPESRIYNGMFFSVGSLAPTSFMGFLQSRVPPAGCCNPTVYNSDKYEQLIKQATEEFDVGKQNAIFNQAIGVLDEDSPVLFVVHDLNLRVLSPKVRGFVQPQSWFADLKNVWVSK
jgi:peptide/nickel transport system substrate-binding protein